MTTSSTSVSPERLQMNNPSHNHNLLIVPYINKTEDYFENKVSRGWMNPDKAENAKNALLEKGVSSIFQVKVKS